MGRRGPPYWLINVDDGQVEVYSNPGPSGYQSHEVLAPGHMLSLVIDGVEVGEIAVADILPAEGSPHAQADPQAEHAEEVLMAVEAARYRAGSTVTLAMIVEVGGVNEWTAGDIRRWARSVGRWAYVDGKRGSRRARSGRSARRG